MVNLDGRERAETGKGDVQITKMDDSVRRSRMKMNMGLIAYAKESKKVIGHLLGCQAVSLLIKLKVLSQLQLD